MSTRISIPFKFIYNENIFSPLKPLPKHIQVEIGGYGWHLVRNWSFSRPQSLYVNIKHPGLHTRLDTLALREYVVSHFKDVEITKIFLDTLAIPFDRKAHKNVYLKVDESTISIAKGFLRDSIITIKPEKITVTGTSSDLSVLKDTLSVVIPFQNLDKDFNERIRLSYFLHNSNLKSSHEKVKVTFKVKRKSYAQSK